MDTVPADASTSTQSATCQPAHPDLLFPTPQLTTMTIAHSNYMGPARPPRMLMRRQSSTIDANPMMRVTLPKEFGDDPLSSPLGALPMPGFLMNESEPEPMAHKQPLESVAESPSKSSSFANVFTRRRQSSIEKKPPMAPMPSLRRSTSVPMKKAFSKMAPMLKRVVTGHKPRDTVLKEVDNENDDENDYDNTNTSRDSLLMLMRVPEVERASLLPLMMTDY